jgi:transcriptional regulator with XRE-family HTH domain
MQKLIKQIRNYANLSQLKFAEKLHVTFQTVNRWENGKANPTKLASDNLLKFVKNYDIPVYDMIINNIKEISSSLKIDKSRIILYHGSKSGLNGEIKPISRKSCDFGTGFYMGTNCEQPLTLISDFPNSKFYIVSINVNNLNSIEIDGNIEWAMIVSFNRRKMDNIKDSYVYNKYKNVLLNKDIVIGLIADDRMFYVMDQFFENYITDIALINSLKALNLGKQYVCKTNTACKNIKIEKEIELSYFEREIIKEVAIKNRFNGINYAKDICKNYRRVGKYFDELLNNGDDING